MKKYLLGLFAIVIAIGFSAFTGKSDNQASKTTDLFWYDQSNNDLNIEDDVVDELARLEIAYPSSDFNSDGSAGVAFEYGRETDSPSGTLITVIYKVD